MYALARSAYFADEDLGEERSADDPTFLHSETFYLLDEHRHIRGIYNGMSTAAVAQLTADAQALLEQMAAGSL
jgi:protein SCO1/2